MCVLPYGIERFVFQITSNSFSIVDEWKGDRGLKIPVVEDKKKKGDRGKH